MGKEKFYKKGAEAELSIVKLQGENFLSKKRIVKNYRNKKLDLEIRKRRTRSEAKLLKEVWGVVNTPKVISVDEVTAEILMEYLSGQRLKEVVSKKPELCTLAGELIKKIHERGVIHGDLTTSNILFVDSKKVKNKELLERIAKKGPLFFIDFGLGYYSKKLEDRATDLVVFKKTFNATHSELKNGWELVMEGYSPSKELQDQMKAIEKRARYH